MVHTRNTLNKLQMRQLEDWLINGITMRSRTVEVLAKRATRHFGYTVSVANVDNRIKQLELDGRLRRDSVLIPRRDQKESQAEKPRPSEQTVSRKEFDKLVDRLAQLVIDVEELKKSTQQVPASRKDKVAKRRELFK